MEVTKIDKLGDGGGWWAHGRGSMQDPRKYGQQTGYSCLHSVTDWLSRLIYIEVHEKLSLA